MLSSSGGKYIVQNQLSIETVIAGPAHNTFFNLLFGCLTAFSCNISKSWSTLLEMFLRSVS